MLNNAKLSIGVVPQELVMDPYFTPRETLNFQSGYYGVKKKSYITEVLLEKLSLEDKADSYVRYLIWRNEKKADDSKGDGSFSAYTNSR